MIEAPRRFVSRNTLVFLSLLGASRALASPPQETPFEHDCAQLSASKGSAHDRLWKLFATHWDYQMREFPSWATYVGYPGQNGRWVDLSLDAIARRRRESQAPRKALATIERGQLTPSDQDNYDLFKYQLDMDAEGEKFPGELLPLNQLEGAQQEVAQLLALMGTGSIADYEDRLSRLRAAPKLIDQVIVLLTEGLRRGVTPPRLTLRDVPDQVKAQEEPDPEKSPLLTSFREMPKTFAPQDRERLFEQAKTIVQSEVIPAFRRLREFLTATYIPKCRESIAWTALPEGKAWYAHRVRRETTTALSPEEIHALGLKEVARIRGAMDALIKSINFQGDFAKFTEFLRTDPRFAFANAHDLVAAYRDIAKRIDPELPRLFGKLPRLTYGVKPVPAYAEKSQTAAYYEQGSPSAGRAGTFFANTYDLKTRFKWEMEALTVHEAVPGHHLQIALGQEMESAPEFRKEGGYTAFVEGWGLYSESLGGELGLYQDPYAKFGQLSFEMWRAIRLVVDTGMHAKGWSRAQAIDYFKSNTGKAEHDIVVEIDRYIVWAGQALAYKTGELKIKALRARAERELGGAFDVRRFHDAVLGHGAVPLDVLESNIGKWIDAERARVAPVKPSPGLSTANVF